jgi:molecular chaperone HtpG
MLIIPSRLRELLEEKRDLQVMVDATLGELEPWLTASGKRPTFFPDYTDHSIQHIQEVLETAVSLVREDAWETFTSGDAAVLILSVVLHDSAMHLSREGFEALVGPDSPWKAIPGFGDQPWRDEWRDFTLEARRFDQKKLLELFGDTDPVHIPDLEALTLDDRTRRLIGEFIRHHHARLAHEIARYGVPGVSSDPLRIPGNSEIADLAGLVARSHGVPARSCLPYLKTRFGSRTNPLGVHPVFLIVLLRIADFLQLQSSRAPEATLKVHRILSPYSAVEWRVHASVRDMREHEEDPEAVYVRANPDDVETYLRLKAWLSSLQDEVDASWAVIGEVYARQGQGMDKLGIRVRRIYSNLDDEDDFSKLVDYLPSHIAFTAAGADLLKLLIGPLYGDRPEIGVRELLQNAVDAVRELNNLRIRHIAPEDPTYSNTEPDVQIELDQDSQENWWLMIRDRGIGMTQTVLCNYFLKAGASFRDSDAWRSQFLDEKGQSRILRAGRFGIGALAAFLLGDEFQVTTRHASALPEDGLAFSASIDTDPIPVYHMTLPVGTTVRIKLHEHSLAVLLAAIPDRKSNPLQKNPRGDVWDWYCLAWPKVIRYIRHLDVYLDQQHILPGESETLPVGWHRILVTGYSDIQWTYLPSAPALTCNGIPLEQSLSHFETTVGFSLRMPKISIFDPDARLPVTLRRDRLATRTFPFYEELLSDVIREYLTAALQTAPERPLQMGEDARWYAGLMFDGVPQRARISTYGHWASTNEGIVPIQASTLWERDAREAVLLPLKVTTREREQEEHFYIPRVPHAEFPLVLPLPAIISPGEDAMGSYFIELFEELSRLTWSQRTAPDDRVLSRLLAAYSLDYFSIVAQNQVFFRAREELVGRRRGNPAAEQLLETLDTAGTFRMGDNTVIVVGEKKKLRGLAKQFGSFTKTASPIVYCGITRRTEPPEASDLAAQWESVFGSRPLPYERDRRSLFLKKIRADRTNPRSSSPGEPR